jgi:hypothetical protein
MKHQKMEQGPKDMKNLSGPRASARGKVLFRKNNPHQRGDHIMPQTLAPFHLEHTTSTGTVTARGGAALLLEAFYATGFTRLPVPSGDVRTGATTMRTT